MSDRTILGLEKVGDVNGLVRMLKEVRTHTEGGRGENAARSQLAGLGIDLSAYTNVSVVDVTGTARLIDDSADVRAEAARALGRLKHRDGNTALAEALHDDNPMVRAAVIDALSAACGKPMQTILAGYESKTNFAKVDAIAQAKKVVGEQS